MPSLAESRTVPGRIDSSATNNDTVNGMPAAAATPITCLQLTPRGSRARPIRTANPLAIEIPSVLPRTLAATIATATRLVAPAASAWPVNGTPALDSAKRGTTT